MTDHRCPFSAGELLALGAIAEARSRRPDRRHRRTLLVPRRYAASGASWRHPSGATIPGDPADYQPPIIDGVPYRADGRPGDLCAGWTARALKASWEVDR